MKPIYKQFIAILILMLPALIIPMIPGMSELLQYDRLAIADGEVWRLMTQHWCHWSMDHLFFDLFEVMIAPLACQLRRKRWFGCRAPDQR